MRQLQFAVCATCLFVFHCTHGASGADDMKAEAMKEELKRLEGAWSITSMAFEGTKIDPLWSSITINGNKLVFDADKGESGGKCSVKIDPAQKPKTIDITVDDDPKKECFLGVYAIDGDVLRFCLCGGEEGKVQQRPDSLEGKGKAEILIVARRKK